MEIIPYGKQFIDKNDKKLVAKSLSEKLITTGPFVEKFEKELKKYLKSKYTFCVAAAQQLSIFLCYH